MQDPLERLHRTKLTLLATVFTVVGLALLVFAKWAEGRPSLHWAVTLPVADLGSALFTTGLVAVAFSYVDGRDSEERATERLHRVIQSEAPTIRDAVIEAFATKPEDLARVATPETLDKIIENSLALRLGNASFAAEIYTDVRDQAVKAVERWHDATVNISLSMDRGTAKGRAPLFVCTVEWQYTVIPKHPSRRFAVVSDIEQYRDVAIEAEETSAWFIPPRLGVDAGSRETFELVQFSVNGDDRPISRAERRHGQIYTATIGKDAVDEGQPVVIRYTYRTVVDPVGHLLYIDIERPTRGIDITFDYGDSTIQRVNVLDFIASSKQARIAETPDSLPTRAVDVGFDDWLFPKSGVAFVWTLQDETSTSRRRPSNDKAA